ncbi:LamG-like jellyroll fold domain-containing protein [Aestuariivivens sp. NBU2969]|uniref:LamG-like jellyroll fold domain-containing protein n=1 Tax=Aestuariivivens sp. NBU2969 TaxID=2873267 RepID=UPI001CBAB7C3|nr:LamG-like jellyroll fold domain-containing protein [Aestuariivivens sp. NBU2969]
MRTLSFKRKYFIIITCLLLCKSLMALCYSVKSINRQNLSPPNKPSKLDFDGINDYIDFGDNTAFEFDTTFSMEAWILQETTVSTGTIISKSNTKTSNGSGYQFTIKNNHPNLKFYNNFGLILVDITSPYPITNNRWYHITATYNGSLAKLFIDGIEVGSASSTPPSYGDEKFLIGATYNSDTPTSPNNYFNGFIDEVRLWNIALTPDQIHEMMNQEIEQDGVAIKGKIIPLKISGGLLWNNLEGYYNMNANDATDKSSYARNGSPENMTTKQEQTAPLPYTTKANGNWLDKTTSTPWSFGDTVWNSPNTIGIDGVTTIDWNIVKLSHTINGPNSNITLLGLVMDTNSQLNIANPNEPLDELNTGHALYISHYLRLDGKIDLIGESQLLQDEGCILSEASTGTLEKDQQGTKDMFTYNYWSSPVGTNNIATDSTSTQNNFTVPDVLKDAVVSSNPLDIAFASSGYDGAPGIANTVGATIADYWIWKYAKKIGYTNSQWQHMRSTGTIYPGEGFTMKGVDNTHGAISQTQNYVFNGMPNNGDIALTIATGNDYLVGNPYPSALDASAFIKDNISMVAGGRNTINVINGSLYFWDHYANSTHAIQDYKGGYATYSLMGGIPSINNDTRINTTGKPKTKTPEQYIPVGQGFFVFARNTEDNNTLLLGGDIAFKNSQRVFQRESDASSTILKSTSFKNIVNKTVDVRQKIRLLYSSPNGYYRELLVGVDENATSGFDIGYDADLFEDNKEDMYWSIDSGAKLTIQAVANFNSEQVLPLAIKTNVDGLSSLKIDKLENVDSDKLIYLHDKALNIYQDLKQEPYEVFLSAGEHTERFEITFKNSNAPSLSTNRIDNNSLNVYFSNEKQSFILHNPKLKEIKAIKIYNVIGQSIYEFTNLKNENYQELKAKKTPTGTYVIKMETIDSTLSKKVLIY